MTLFNILQCVSVAPFGLPVVPLVNCILMASSACKIWLRLSSCLNSGSLPSSQTSRKLSIPGVLDSPIRITISRLGSFLDSSTEGNDGTANNGASIIRAKIGEGSLELDGINDSMSVNLSGFTNEITISTWVKLNDFTGTHPRIVTNTSFDFYINGSNLPTYL